MDQVKSCDLDCRLDDCLFFSVTKLARVFGKMAEESFGKTGLSPSHALILYLVNRNGPLHQKEIGEKLHLTPSTITRFIEKLETKGLVTKTIEGKNAFIATTDKGLALQPEVIQAWHLLHEKYANILSEEEAIQFIGLSEKLLSALDHQED